jgi:hypothetical protein
MGFELSDPDRLLAKPEIAEHREHDDDDTDDVENVGHVGLLSTPQL